MPETLVTRREQDWLKQLQAHGYRLTAPRLAVVQVIAESNRVLNPFDVFDQARQRYSKLGLVTVYRTLEKLEELILIQRVHQPTGCQGFIAASEGHQHLLICQACGVVTYFSGDGETIQALQEDVEEISGYHIQAHWLQLFGICQDCRINGSTLDLRTGLVQSQ